ncbi:hypothetical protein BDW42DRAFT_173402 [Aspergillus taichungensis]|uniref:Uncharacterized protein n=1 Tax=Aspergillus taichungensis TaxID=482145 RepID=A0A2J5HPU4_9EURO|nr:hypothetical protein BDW42DRAFT_173402 [Aspergillus taichungensis]
MTLHLSMERIITVLIQIMMISVAFQRAPGLRAERLARSYLPNASLCMPITSKKRKKKKRKKGKGTKRYKGYKDIWKKGSTRQAKKKKRRSNSIPSALPGSGSPNNRSQSSGQNMYTAKPENHRN